MHLAEIRTSDNLHNGCPSTLLRSVPVDTEKCGGGRTETFPILQYKSLASGAVLQLTLTVLDVSGKKLFRLSERDPTYKKWLTQVAPGALGNAMGLLWLISVTPKVSAGIERKIDCNA